VKISSGEKCFGCGSHLDKGANGLFCKRLLLGTYISLNTDIEIFRTVIFPVILYGCETLRPHNYTASERKYN
jgi:hypothetical protein